MFDYKCIDVNLLALVTRLVVIKDIYTVLFYMVFSGMYSSLEKCLIIELRFHVHKIKAGHDFHKVSLTYVILYFYNCHVICQ